MFTVTVSLINMAAMLSKINFMHLCYSLMPVKPTKWHSTWLSPRSSPNFAYAPLFLPYSLNFLPKKTIIGHSGNEWEMFWFHLFFDNSSSLRASPVTSRPLWFSRGTRHLQYPLNNFSPGESPQNGTQPGLFLGIFLTVLHCHPKNSREKVPWEKGGPLDTSLCLQVRCKKKMVAAIAQTAWCLKQLQFAFPAKSFQANTAKLGMVFGRARPNVGTYRLLRDVLRCLKL